MFVDLQILTDKYQFNFLMATHTENSIAESLRIMHIMLKNKISTWQAVAHH